MSQAPTSPAAPQPNQGPNAGHSNPVVADSPVPLPASISTIDPNTDLSGTAGHSGDGNAPTQASVTPAVPAVEQQPEQGQPQVSAEREKINKLGETLGIDVSGFSSDEDARRAARAFAERLSFTPPQPQQPFQQQQPQHVQQPPVAPPTPAEIPNFDELPAEVQAYIRKQDSESKAVREQLEQFNKQRETEREQQQQRYEAEIDRRGNAALDKLAHPLFGVAGNRTTSQTFARRNVVAAARAFAEGLAYAGQRVPTIEEAVDAIISLEGENLGLNTQQQQQQQQQQQVPIPTPTSASGLPKPLSAPQRANKHKGVPDEQSTYLGDEEFMKGAYAILNR